MTPVATPIFDLIALVVSSAIFSLAVAFVQVLVAQALDRPYRLRPPARPVRARLRELPSIAAPRAARPGFVKRELELPGAA